jgi:hypothetical protein
MQKSLNEITWLAEDPPSVCWAPDGSAIDFWPGAWDDTPMLWKAMALQWDGPYVVSRYRVATI